MVPTLPSVHTRKLGGGLNHPGGLCFHPLQAPGWLRLLEEKGRPPTHFPDGISALARTLSHAFVCRRHALSCESCRRNRRFSARSVLTSQISTNHVPPLGGLHSSGVPGPLPEIS